MNWLELAPAPRNLPEAAGPFGDPPLKWDVFVSYRSVDRPWALALYDQLVAAKFHVFMDQFVLRPGIDLAQSLSDELDKSASGVLVLSEEVAGAQWVEDECTKMRQLRDQRRGTPLPFNYVIARIDKSRPAFRDQSAIFVDFSEGYEDVPRGAELVRLVHGLVGVPLTDAIVRAAIAADETVKKLLIELKTTHVIGDLERMVNLLSSGAAELRESPGIAAFGAKQLISAKHEVQALDVLRAAQKTFPRSVRLQQLEGLALRRLAADPGRRRAEREARIKEAQLVLGRLYAAGHRDPETLGLYGATWWVRYQLGDNPGFLERSRDLYQEAFELSPKDEYVGINAASKSALLGELDLARQLAERVGPLVDDYADGSHFYKAFSLAEALLLLGRYDESAVIYDKARRRHPNMDGDIGSTRAQVEALIAALNVPGPTATKLRQALKVS